MLWLKYSLIALCIITVIQSEKAVRPETPEWPESSNGPNELNKPDVSYEPAKPDESDKPNKSDKPNESDQLLESDEACEHRSGLPHADPEFYQVSTILVDVDTVSYSSPGFAVKNVPYSAIRGIQKTQSLVLPLRYKKTSIDPNMMLEWCVRVRDMFVHLIDIQSIKVFQSMPSECFELGSPMNTVEEIDVFMFDESNGFPFDHYTSTKRVYIRSSTPIIAIDSLWSLSKVVRLCIQMTQPPRFIADDEVVSKFIRNTAKDLNELELSDCGSETFNAILEAYKNGRLPTAKFVHKTISVHWEEKEITLKAASTFNVSGFEYDRLPSQFEKITVIGSIDVAEPKSRYNSDWRVKNHGKELEFGELGWYIFVGSENVSAVDLRLLKINGVDDSFWFVYNSISSIPNLPSSHPHRESNPKNNLYVTHGTSDAGYSAEVNELIENSMARVKEALKSTRRFEYIIIEELKDGEFVETEDICLKDTWDVLFG